MKTKYTYLLLLVVLSTACNKDILNKKPDRSLVVPATLADFQALLDNTTFVFGTDRKGMMEVLCADHYVNLADAQSASISLRNGYTWQQDIYGVEVADDDWNASYRQIYNANVVLDGINELDESVKNTNAFNNTKGIALFFRANAFWTLTQLYTEPYRAEIAESSLGIPLRITSDFNVVSVRANLQETYQQIIDDLQQAASLLPVQQDYKTQPSRAAAWALLARTALTMREYEAALEYAEQSLLYDNHLLDYNSLDTNSRFPIPDMNEEVLFRATSTNYGVLFSIGVCKMDSLLVKSYQGNDLRRSIFYIDNIDGTQSFRGHYTGTTVPFGGITTSEVYLIKAECLARQGQIDEAVAVLQELYVNRHEGGNFEQTYTSQQDLLSIILLERRKELVFRGLRWSDLRRLNLESEHAVTLRRTIDGQDYELPPNDPRYTQLIHSSVIDITGMPQNRR